MARIEDAAIQDEIANSLLGEEVQESSEPSQDEQSYGLDVHGDEFLNEAIEDQRANRLVLGDDGMPRREEEAEEQNEQRELENRRIELDEDTRSRMLTAEEARQLSEQQPQEQAALPSLAEAIETYKLNDADANRQLASEWGAAFGLRIDDFVKVDSEKVGRALSEMGLAAIESFVEAKGDLGKVIGNVPVETANRFMHEILSGFGENPQLIQGNRQAAASVLWGAVLNIVRTHNETGSLDPQILNHPEAAQFYLGEYLKTHGIDAAKVPNFREMSLRVANALTQHVVGMIQRRANAGQQMQQRPSRSSRSRAPRIPGGRVRGMKSNADLFDKSTLEHYRAQHGRL